MTKSTRYRSLAKLTFAILLAAAPCFAQAQSPVDTWQYSVRVGSDPTRRAYLWLPDRLTYVRGLMIGVQNMLEEPMFEDPQIRQALTDSGMGIVWIAPGDDLGVKGAPFHNFTPPAERAADIQTILERLAETSGYPEIASAPLMPTAHSASTPFVWGISSVLGPKRIMAILPYKGWFTGHAIPGVPILHVASEYGEVGGVNWGETYLKDRVQMMRLRTESTDRLIGEAVDIGSGHFEWNANFSNIIAMYIRKAAKARLPEQPRAGEQVILKTIDPHSGWVIAADDLGTSKGVPVPYDTPGIDASHCFWYLDKEIGEAINKEMVENLSKKPQVIDFIEDGKPIELIANGFAILRPRLMKDGVSFQVQAAPLDKSPTLNLYHGDAVNHAKGPIQFRVSTGALKQTGPDTFRVWRRRGGLVQQGPPWEPWIMAWQPGDKTFRRADRPARPQIPVVLTDGKDQNLTIPAIPDQPVGTKQLTLKGASDAGLPIQFFVISGPVELAEDGATLRFLHIPPRTHFPLEVVLGAYQWGHVNEPMVKTANVEFSFRITQPEKP